MRLDHVEIMTRATACVALTEHAFVGKGLSKTMVEDIAIELMRVDQNAVKAMRELPPKQALAALLKYIERPTWLGTVL